MLLIQTPESVIHDVLDDIPETAGLTWGRKVDIATAIVNRITSRSDCLHIEDCPKGYCR